ncbi:MAG: hypothetical protein EB084_08200, partial [Proteobacteria bacterium]|nr:hypothetical protein [Pseudomonadota bacterium]
MIGDHANPRHRMTVETGVRRETLGADLTEDELRLAIALSGATVCRQSPLIRSDGAYVTPSQPPWPDHLLDQLYRKGLLAVSPEPALTPAWTQALTILADPLWNVRMVLGDPRDETFETYYARGALNAGSLVYFRPAEGDTPCHIEIPFGPDDLLKLLEEARFLSLPAASEDSGAELSFAEYTALLAIIDALRTRHIESALARTPEVETPLALDEIERALSRGLQTFDARWLVSIGGAVSPFELGVPADGWGSSLNGLVSRGYLTAQQGGWLPSASLRLMTDTLLTVPAYFVIELIMNKSDDLFEIHYFAAIRGTNALWVLDYFSLATPFPRVCITTLPGEELVAMFSTLVNESAERSEAALRGRAQTKAATHPVS